MAQTKERANYSIDQKILQEFNAETKKQAINKSALLEQFMQNWVKQNKNR
jgi:hypothetical protein